MCRIWETNLEVIELNEINFDNNNKRGFSNSNVRILQDILSFWNLTLGFMILVD